MTTQILTNKETVTEQKIRFRGFWLTPTEIEKYLEDSAKHHEKLVTAAKKRGPILIDSDYDGIQGDMAMWRERYLERVSR